MATWNSRSMTKNRFDFCKGLKYDVLAITELWRSAPKFTINGSCQWTHSKPELNSDGSVKFPDDRAAGVGILLSNRAAKICISHGSPCERVTWVRLKGPVVDIVVIATCMSHRARANPSQHDTANSLIELLTTIPHNDCVIVLGDLNV